MTTIVYRDGVLAGDSRVTIDDMVSTDKQTKVHKLRDGRLYGWAGGVEDAERLRQALRKNAPPPALQEISALLIDTDGAIHLYEGNIWIEQKGEPYYAVGSGAPYALGALDAGCSALDAAKIAIKRDINSGGKVRTVKLGGKA